MCASFIAIYVFTSSSCIYVNIAIFYTSDFSFSANPCHASLCHNSSPTFALPLSRTSPLLKPNVFRLDLAPSEVYTQMHMEHSKTCAFFFAMVDGRRRGKRDVPQRRKCNIENSRVFDNVKWRSAPRSCRCRQPPCRLDTGKVGG